MASGMFNKAKESGAVDWDADTIKWLLVGTGYVHDPDVDFVSGVTANELSGTGYARKTLAATTTLDDTNDKVIHDAPDQTYTGADFGTVHGGIAYKEVTDDTDSVPIVYVELSSDVTTNGGDFTFQMPSGGLYEGS